jgi:hypothetical protein
LHRLIVTWDAMIRSSVIVLLSIVWPATKVVGPVYAVNVTPVRSQPVFVASGHTGAATGVRTILREPIRD